jgi:enoyl-[acyl-carrier protein] reductase I
MKLLKGKKGIVTGVINNMSIAWAVAKLAYVHGAEIAITYQSEELQKRVFPLLPEVECNLALQCDVTDENSINKMFDTIGSKWSSVDFLIHAIAYSDKEELRGRYIDTTLKNFLNSMNISCYSLTALSRGVEPLMKKGGSIVSMTYLGAQKVIPNYNVMGVAKAALESSIKYLANDMGPNNIRVNGISAGPIRTLASSGIGDFRSMLQLHSDTSPLKRNTSLEDVAGASLYLLSDLSNGVTGEIHHVDCGYNIMGMNYKKL